MHGIDLSTLLTAPCLQRQPATIVWHRNIKAFVNSLRKERAFEAFKDPVPKNTPGYFEVIKKPMDLGTIAGSAAPF